MKKFIGVLQYSSKYKKHQPIVAGASFLVKENYLHVITISGLIDA